MQKLDENGISHKCHGTISSIHVPLSVIVISPTVSR